MQARCVGLAKLGFFVLAVDAFGAGERAIGKALGEYHGEMVAATLWPIGRPLSGLQVYENQRAVDYLLTRPEVDGARLGITGASGGGNQTMYAGAWDERLKAAVPVCSVGNYQAYLGAACCMCEVVPGALEFTEEWGVLGLTAPRALMVINATRDAFQFSVGEAKKSLVLVEPIYRLYDRPENVRHTVFESPHAYNQPMREAMYGWMTKHLVGEGDASPVPEPEMELEDPETLRCYPGETRPDDWMTIPQFAAREGRKLIEGIRVPGNGADWRATALRLRRRLDRDVLGGTKPRPSSRRRDRDEWTADRLAYESEPGISLMLFREPGRAPRTNDAVVLLTIGAAEASEPLDVGSLASDIVSSGRTLFQLGLRATGERSYPNDRIGRAPDHNTAEWSLWLGRPLLGQWVLDLRTAIEGFVAQPGRPGKLTVVGIGPAGVVALCAAALDSRIHEVVTVGSLASYLSDVPFEGQRLGLMAPAIVRDVGDIQHLVALVAPRKVVMARGVDGADRSLDVAALEKQFDFTRRVYALERAADQFTARPSSDNKAILRDIGILPGGPRGKLRAGAAVIDVTPEKLPVIVNGSMLSRSVDKINTRLHARALALSDGTRKIAIVVVDSCMMPRPLLDEAKRLAAERTGIAADHILISATHTHSAPACMGGLGTDADPSYGPFLREKLVEAVAAALATLEPAKVGFASADAAEFTALRRWIRRPDRIAADPFGNATVRANMHAGRNWDDVNGGIGSRGPRPHA